MITQQMMNPKIAYIGDQVVLSTVFNIESQFLSELTKNESTIDLPISSFVEAIEVNDFEITRIYLNRSGVNYYNLVIEFIPWTTGEFSFPQYDLGLAAGGNEGVLLIQFEQEYITSITEQNSITQLNSYDTPLLLPGTHYKLYGIIILLVIFFILLLQMLIKHKSLSALVKKYIKLYKYRKNRRRAEKELQGLLAKELSDSLVAQKIQAIMRKYLEFRYEYPFSNTVSSQMMNAFEKIAGAYNEILENKKLDAAFVISQTFIRTDFVRYSKEGAFSQGEKEEIINQLLENIKILELQEENKVAQVC